MVKLLMLIPAMLIAGMLLGGGSAYTLAALLQGRPVLRLDSPNVFVATGTINAPLVSRDGQLLGYVAFDAQLEIPGIEEKRVRANLPLLLDAVNLRTFKAPIAGGRDGLLPDLAVFRAVVRDASRQVYGPSLVSRVVITQASML
ncbi:hypothetical protein [Sphingomonas morindae]|uniref:Uncharacterized protein n=1 Tax=Sphingomonas morindae TaxID=1541170 RepID=A0ABY4X530_9SPHN|nr:hypothetical protein [Sphingomonas morindae]USI71995.1 hypothetical protein LHA26_11820 [Sphingomonas morindae]